MEMLECLRCGEFFHPVHTPVRRCPRCTSSLWNQPRTRAIGGGRKATRRRKPVSLAPVRATASEARVIQVRNRLVRVKTRLNPPTVVHLAALFGVSRQAATQWLNGQNAMAMKHYRVLKEIERKVGIQP